MLIATLNGRPVMIGTKLDYVDPAKKEMWGDNYLTVTAVGPHIGVDYVGNAGEIQGNISLKELPNVFKHHKEIKTETGNVKTYSLGFIADLLSIPDGRLDAALDELKIGLRTMRLGLTAMAESISDDLNVRFEPEDFQVLAFNRLPKITWTDDGKNETILNVGQESLTVQMKSDPMKNDS
jgi:hypothetical protein